MYCIVEMMTKLHGSIDLTMCLLLSINTIDNTSRAEQMEALLNEIIPRFLSRQFQAHIYAMHSISLNSKFFTKPVILC
jgi:hypothetical protein